MVNRPTIDIGKGLRAVTLANAQHETMREGIGLRGGEHFEKAGDARPVFRHW